MQKRLPGGIAIDGRQTLFELLAPGRQRLAQFFPGALERAQQLERRPLLDDAAVFAHSRIYVARDRRQLFIDERERLVGLRARGDSAQDHRDRVGLRAQLRQRNRSRRRGFFGCGLVPGLSVGAVRSTPCAASEQHDSKAGGERTHVNRK